MTGSRAQSLPDRLAERFSARPEISARDVDDHSRFVSVMRVVLPALAVVLLVLLLSWPSIIQQATTGGVTILMEEIGALTDDLHMVHPTYRGTDASGRTYTVSAASAVPDSPDPTRVTLSELTANITQADGRSAEITAKRGLYLPKEEMLVLDGDILVTSEDGYRATLKKAFVDLANGVVSSDTPIVADGPVGSLRADSFEASEEDGVVRFEGGVRMTIMPGQRDKGADAVPDRGNQ